MDKTHLDPGRTVPPRSPDALTPGADLRPGSAAHQGAPSDPLHDVRILGEYRVLRRLGEGGMGAVYLGYDGQHGRTVALKVLNDGLVTQQNYIDRFYREARSGAQLNHPNIVRTFAAGQDGATSKYYLVLEFVDGPSAQMLLARDGRLSVDDAVYLALHVARALEHAHSRNIVHRDIKPDNILITRSGVAKLGDLGLAKRTDEISHLTAARQGFGTTAYMPYEQAISARQADGRSDIYALGATLYHLLTGRVPFPGDNHLEVVEKKNQGIFAPAGFFVPSVPATLDVILAKMLARDPRDRYQTASELIIDLERSAFAAAMPSFADPGLASKDPCILAHLSPGEPTRPDPEVVALPERPVAEKPLINWIVRYRNSAGRRFTARLTTKQIARRLDEKTLPRNAEARPAEGKEFVPLSDIDEFRKQFPADASSATSSLPRQADPEHAGEPLSSRVSKARRQTVQATPPAPPSWQTFMALLGAGAVIAALVLVLVRWLLPH